MANQRFNILIIMLMVLLISTYHSELSAKEATTVEQSLVNAANELNKQVPMTLDVDTRLDGVIAFKKTLRYKYTLFNTPNDKNYLRKLRSIKEPELINNMCSSKNTSILLKGGVNFISIYFDEKGIELLRFDIDKSKCRY